MALNRPQSQRFAGFGVDLALEFLRIQTNRRDDFAACRILGAGIRSKDSVDFFGGKEGLRAPVV